MTTLIEILDYFIYVFISLLYAFIYLIFCPSTRVAVYNHSYWNFRFFSICVSFYMYTLISLKKIPLPSVAINSPSYWNFKFFCICGFFSYTYSYFYKYFCILFLFAYVISFNLFLSFIWVMFFVLLIWKLYLFLKINWSCNCMNFWRKKLSNHLPILDGWGINQGKN